MKKQKTADANSLPAPEDQAKVEMEPLMRATSTSSTSSGSSSQSFEPLDSPASYALSQSLRPHELPQLLRCPHQPLLSESLLRSLLPHLPTQLIIRPAWTLLYSTSLHGHALSTLYYQLSLNADTDGPNLLLCRDSDDWIFGCYTPVSWVQREVYYGSAECFVFRAWPDFHVWEAVEERQRRELRDRRLHRDEQRAHRREEQFALDEAAGFDAALEVREPEDSPDEAEEPTPAEGRYYMLAKGDQLAIGSGRRFALWFDSSFRDGASGPCSTFDSPTLSKRPNFKAMEVECWGF